MTTLVRTGGLKKKKPVDPWSTMLGGLQAGTVVNPKTVGSGVDDQIKAGQAGITAASALQRLQLENQAKRAQGFAQALGQITAPDPKAIADEYRTSADRLRGFGTGLTGAVAEAQQSNADRIANEVHRVTGGLGNIASYDIPNLRNVAQMTGVVMPASSLEEKAAGAYASANAERAGSVGSIGSIAQEYLRKLDELEADVGAKSTALAAQRPSLFNDALKAAQENSRNNIATYIQARYLGNSLRTTDATLTGVDPVTHKPTAAAKAAAAAAKAKLNPAFDATNSKAIGKIVDQWGNEIGGKTIAMPGFHLDPKSPTGVKKDAKPKGVGSGSTHIQSKTINGNTVLFDPGTGAYYLPGDTKNPIDPNTLKAKTIRDPEKVRSDRAAAMTGLAKDLDTDSGIDPADIYRNAVAGGIPGWIELQVLKQEALHHKGDQAWDSVLKKGWLSGPKKKKKK